MAADGKGFPAVRMADPAWVAERVADTGRRWGSENPRVNGTLWWYSASSTLTGLPVTTAMITGFAAGPRLGDGRAFLRADGSLGGFTAATALPIADGLSVLASELAESLRAVIDALAEASGVRTAAMWAIATDSIANRALDAGSACGDRARGSAFAHELVGALRRAGIAMPNPRFVDVETSGSFVRVSDPLGSEAAGYRRFTQRASCCLIYETGRSDKCVSCPRRPDADRVRRLAALVG